MKSYYRAIFTGWSLYYSRSIEYTNTHTHTHNSYAQREMNTNESEANSLRINI